MVGGREAERQGGREGAGEKVGGNEERMWTGQSTLIN